MIKNNIRKFVLILMIANYRFYATILTETE